MLFTNLSDASEQVDFKTAVLTGLGRRQGLFFPDIIEPLNDVDQLFLAVPEAERDSVLAKLGKTTTKDGEQALYCDFDVVLTRA